MNAYADNYDQIFRASRPRETHRRDYLRITEEWTQTDDRRCQLIEKEFSGGGRNASENAEFADLQGIYRMRRSYLRWLRTGDANNPLINEAALKRLQEEDDRPRECCMCHKIDHLTLVQTVDLKGRKLWCHPDCISPCIMNNHTGKH